ncbi:MAG: hypothetical protein JJT82_04875 [Legionellaceae bacterium]|nr:hypothetical protein [Legionellaceae bacterium]
MKLIEYQRIQSSGARGVEIFNIEGNTFLAIPQLAEDISTDPPNMNGGNSMVDVVIYQWKNKAFDDYQRIVSYGNEHVSFYAFDGRYFLAVASIRSGKSPNFEMNIPSVLYEWQDDCFAILQSFDTFAAKSCQFFTMDNQHYLGFSEGVQEAGMEDAQSLSSHLYHWTGEHFELFQSLPSAWGYDMSFFQIDGCSFLAIADNSTTSTIYKWNGERFVPFQDVAEQGGGRQFCYFSIQNHHYLAFANLLHDSVLYRWDGTMFREYQVLHGKAARNFYVLQRNNQTYLFRTNFMTGTREQPITQMDSTVYQWCNQQFYPIVSYETHGGTESHAFESDNRIFLVVSNSLSQDVRFQTPTIVYEVSL